MHDTIFSDAFRPPRFVVLRLPLLTYTIGHELVLIGQRNPLALDPESALAMPWNVAGEWLMKAVLVCCEHRPRWLSWWESRCLGAAVDSEVRKFLAYRMAGSLDFPTVQQPRVKGVPHHYFGGPELARLINYVTERHEAMIATHFEGSPLNFPLGLARCLYSAHGETEGALWIENHKDVEMRLRKEAFDRDHPDNTIAIGEDAVQKMAEEWNREHPNEPAPLMREPKTNN
jgi:hypothetical protein